MKFLLPPIQQQQQQEEPWLWAQICLFFLEAASHRQPSDTKQILLHTHQMSTQPLPRKTILIMAVTRWKEIYLRDGISNDFVRVVVWRSNWHLDALKCIKYCQTSIRLSLTTCQQILNKLPLSGGFHWFCLQHLYLLIASSVSLGTKAVGGSLLTWLPIVQPSKTIITIGGTLNIWIAIIPSMTKVAIVMMFTEFQMTFQMFRFSFLVGSCIATFSLTHPRPRWRKSNAPHF